MFTRYEARQDVVAKGGRELCCFHLHFCQFCTRTSGCLPGKRRDYVAIVEKKHSTARKNVMFKNVLISSETRALCQYLHVITKSHFHEIEFVSKKRNSFTRKANWQAPNLRYTLSHWALYTAH